MKGREGERKNGRKSKRKGESGREGMMVEERARCRNGRKERDI